MLSTGVVAIEYAVLQRSTDAAYIHIPHTDAEHPRRRENPMKIMRPVLNENKPMDYVTPLTEE
jgi:hypothetical protein